MRRWCIRRGIGVKRLGRWYVDPAHRSYRQGGGGGGNNASAITRARRADITAAAGSQHGRL
jgi:hypothetical protein